MSSAKKLYLKPTAKPKSASKKAGKLVDALHQLDAKDEDDEDEEVLPAEDEDSERVPLERLQGVVRDTRPAWMKKRDKEAGKPKSTSEEAAQPMDTGTDQVKETEDIDTLGLPKSKGPRLLRPRMPRAVAPLLTPIVPLEATSTSSSSVARPKPIGASVISTSHAVAPRPPSTPPPKFMPVSQKPVVVPATAKPSPQSPPGLASSPGLAPSRTSDDAKSSDVGPSLSKSTLPSTSDAKALGDVVATSKPSGFTSSEAKVLDIGKASEEVIGGVTSKSAAILVPPPPTIPKTQATAAIYPQAAATSKSAALLKPTLSTPAAVQHSVVLGASELATSNFGTSNFATSNNSISNNTAPQRTWEGDWDSWQSARVDPVAHSDNGTLDKIAESDNRNFHALLAKERELTSSLRRELEGFMEHRKRKEESSEHFQKVDSDLHSKLEARCQELQEEAMRSNASSRQLEKDCDDLRSHLQARAAENMSQVQAADFTQLLRGELHAAFADKMALHRRCEEFQSVASKNSEIQARCDQLQEELEAKLADKSIDANLYKADKEGLEQMWRQSERKATDAIKLAEELKAKETQALEAYQTEVKACMFLQTRGKGYETIACEQTAAKLRESESAEKMKVALKVSEERASKEEHAAKALKREFQEVEERYRGMETKAKAMVTQTKSSVAEELAEKTKSEQVLKFRIEQDAKSLKESLSVQSKLERDMRSLKDSLAEARDEAKHQERERERLIKAESEMESKRCSLDDRLIRFEQDERTRIREDIARAQAEDAVARREVLDKKLAKLNAEKDRRLKEEEASMRSQLDRQITKYQIKLETQQENYTKARQENTDLRGKLAKADGLAKFYESAEESLAQKLALSECQEFSGTSVLNIVGAHSGSKLPEDQTQLLHRVAVATGNVSALSKENEILERRLDLAIRQRREAFKKVHVLRHAFKLHRAQSEFDVDEQQRLAARLSEEEERARAAEQVAAKFKRGAMQSVAMWKQLLSGDTNDIDIKHEDGHGQDQTIWRDVKMKGKEEDVDDRSINKQGSDDEDEAQSEGTLLEEDSPKSSRQSRDWIVKQLGGRYEYLRNCKDQIYGLAHRLDCDTSGPLVLATNAGAMTILKRSMQSGHWYKEYLALMHGLIPESRWAGRISYRLHSKFKPGQGQLTTISERGKPAETHYQAVQFYRRQVGNKVNYYTLVRCRIVTGRTHQIRVHLAALGERLGLRPRGLVGDSKYAFPISTLRDDNMLCNRIFLHASVLQLPALGEEAVGAELNRPLMIESPLPYDLRRALGKLEPDTEQNEAVAHFKEFLKRSSRRAVPLSVKRRDSRLESRVVESSSIRLVARSGT